MNGNTLDYMEPKKPQDTEESEAERARRERKGGWIEQMDALLKDSGLRLTFSINCHSGIASFVADGHQCGCKRCRIGRGEQWTEETERQAALDSKTAQAGMREWAKHVIEKGGTK